MGEWKSTEIGEIAGALAKAQLAMGKLLATRTVKVPGKDGKNGYEYNFANLSDAHGACMGALNGEGISVIQFPAASERNGVEVTTMLTHSSGQWILSPPLFMPVRGGAQDVGSAITYGRRYQLLAMVGLAPEDDDGAKAQAAKPDRWSEQRPPTPKPDNNAPRDPLAPRASAGVANGIVAHLKTVAAALEVEDDEKTALWEELLGRADIDLAPYVAADRKAPGNARRLTQKDAGAVKKAASLWVSELAKVRTEGGDDGQI